MQNGNEVGSISEMAYSSRLEKNIGIGLISNTMTDDAGNLCVAVDSESRSVNIHSLPFIR